MIDKKTVTKLIYVCKKNNNNILSVNDNNKLFELSVPVEFYNEVSTYEYVENHNYDNNERVFSPLLLLIEYINNLNSSIRYTAITNNMKPFINGYILIVSSIVMDIKVANEFSKYNTFIDVMTEGDRYMKDDFRRKY